MCLHRIYAWHIILFSLVHESQRRSFQSNHGSCDSGIMESLIPRTNSSLKTVLFGRDSPPAILNFHTNRPTKKKSPNSSLTTGNHPRSKPVDVVHNKLKHSATGTISRSSSCEWSDSSVDLYLSRTNSLESMNKISDNQMEGTQLEYDDDDSQHSSMCNPLISFSEENLSEMKLCDNETANDAALHNFIKPLSPIQEGNSPKSPLSTASDTCTFEPGLMNSDKTTEETTCIEPHTIKCQESKSKKSKDLAKYASM